MKLESKKAAVTAAISTGIPTFAICFVLFIFLNKQAMTMPELIADCPITIGVTAFICALIQFFLIKSSAKKGKAVEMPAPETQAAYTFFPKNGVAFLIVLSLVTFVIFAGGLVGLLTIFCPTAVFPRFGYIFIKSFVTAFGAAYATFHANVFYPAYYSKQNN